MTKFTFIGTGFWTMTTGKQYEIIKDLDGDFYTFDDFNTPIHVDMTEFEEVADDSFDCIDDDADLLIDAELDELDEDFRKREEY